MALSNLARVEANGDRPLYLQLADWLRADIAARAPGERIDSEPQLARRFGVSRFTVTRAIEILVDEGLVTRRQGLGSFIAAPALRRAPAYLLSFSEAVAAAGRVASHRLLAFGPTPWRETLPFPESAALLRMDRLRLVDRVPTAIHRSVVARFVAERIGLTVEVASAPRFSLYGLFAAAGLVAARGVETLRARRASAEEARLLRLGADRVVMAVRRQTLANDGLVLDLVDAVYDARRYAYEAEIRRDAPSAGGGQQGSRAPASRAPGSRVKENVHASNAHAQRAFGPRLGPWGSGGRSGGGR